MTNPKPNGRIETVRGQIGDERAERLLRFWSSQAGLEGEEAQRRLSEVVCLLLDDAGEIIGVNSAYAAAVPLIGGRRFWVYRSLLPDVSEAEPAMIGAAFAALEAEFEPTGGGPIGLCVVVDDPAEMERHPEAIWPGTELMFAGYLPDNRQVRVRYFEDAAIGPGLPNSPTLSQTRAAEYPLEDRYRLEPFAATGEVTHDDVLAMWRREGAVPEAEAGRRVHEVHLVAVERSEGVVGVSSAYLQRNAQLRMDLLYYRAFVARPHRKSSLAALLAIRGRELLDERFVSGEDTRAAGIIYEVENPGLKSYFNRALWLPTDFTFIGENERGDHVRVHYFPGATVALAAGLPISKE
jgi:hypothetical protein